MTVSTPSSTRSDHILDSAYLILLEAGGEGLTMRKVAARTGISLSNVQYYFPNRDALLSGLVDRYFTLCFEEVSAVMAGVDSADRSVRVRRLLELGLAHGTEVSDMCKIFRELWALATRNTHVRDSLKTYYERLSDLLATSIAPELAAGPVRDRLRALILPYIEGYSITGPALPLAHTDVVDMMTHLSIQVLDDRI